MVLSVFVGTSLDGFIARPSGAFDFLKSGGEGPHGYEEFIASIDTIVIGRGTFDVVVGMGPWFYGDKRVVVLSTRPINLSVVKDGKVEQMAGPPEQIVSQLAASGSKNIYVDGGITIQNFLRAGFINRVIITRVPVLIGEGIPLFGPVPHDIRLRHVRTQEFPGGAVQSEYEVIQK